VGNRPTVISPRRLKDCDFFLLFRSPKALKVPSRHHVEVRVKPAAALHCQPDIFGRHDQNFGSDKIRVRIKS